MKIRLVLIAFHSLFCLVYTDSNYTYEGSIELMCRLNCESDLDMKETGPECYQLCCARHGVVGPPCDRVYHPDAGLNAKPNAEQNTESNPNPNTEPNAEPATEAPFN